MNGEERNIFPGGITNRANEGIMYTNVCSYAWEMKGVRTFGCINGGSLTCLHAVQTDSTTTLESSNKKTKTLVQIQNLTPFLNAENQNFVDTYSELEAVAEK